MPPEKDIGAPIIRGLNDAIAFEQGALAARVSIRNRPPLEGSVESALASGEIFRHTRKKPRPDGNAQRERR